MKWKLKISVIIYIKIKKMTHRRVKSHNAPSILNDDDPEFDDDGRPLTIAAAQKTFHKNNKPVYFMNTKYQSLNEAEGQLIEG